MQDKFSRHINYLRISVTDRCNLRCIYCMPAEGVQCLPHAEILTIEEILAVVRAGVQVGIDKVRLTGGEPLLRRGILDLVAGLRDIPGINDLAITTNGLLLEQLAGELKAAGLNRVNISLDTLKPHRFSQITRGGDLNQVRRGIQAALEAGLHPVKLNTVAMRDFNQDELVDLARLSMEYPLHVRFIELMPVGASNTWAREKYMSNELTRALISEELGELVEEKTTLGAGPARYSRLPGARGTIGFISAMSDHFCARCNRLRLTSTGQLRPCLFNRWEKDLKSVLRSGADQDSLIKIFRAAILEKPDGHDLVPSWQRDDRLMSQIGG